MRSLIQEYEHLAPCYDRRWHNYLARSLNATLARLQFRCGERVLDIGCGTGELLRRLQATEPSLVLTGLDPSAPMLGRALPKLTVPATLVQASARQLPFPDMVFDWVICTSVLHYLPEPSRAVAEIKRVLKPGARLALTDWCNDYLTSRMLAGLLRLRKSAFAHIYTTSECRELLEREGLRVTRLDRYKISPTWGLMTIIGISSAGDAR